jgi:hypothetical protein
MAKFNTGQSFADGDQVTGAKLNNIVGLLDIYSGVIADQTAIAATVSTADLLLIADTDAGSSGAANKVTIQKLLNDTLTGGTFTNANIAEQLTYGTATGNRTISTSATITTGTIPNLTSSTATITLGTIPTLTAGTTTSTAANITNGTVQTLTASTANISQGSAILTQGTIATLNSTTGTIGNFSTTLVGDLTISTGSATVGTRVAVVNTAQEYTAAHNFNATTLTSGNSIAWNLQSNQVARLVLSTTGTMADATNKVDGATYILLVTQGTGSNTLDWNATYKWPGGTKPTLTTGSGKSDIFTFISDGTSLFGATSKNYS